MSVRAQEPKRIWWARPGKLCGMERPGGGGRSHRPERREAEIAYLKSKGVRLLVSTMTSRHNLGAYEAAGLEWHHVPVESAQRGAEALAAAARAGLMVNGYTCALLGVDLADVDALMRGAGPGERQH